MGLYSGFRKSTNNPQKIEITTSSIQTQFKQSIIQVNKFYIMGITRKIKEINTLVCIIKGGPLLRFFENIYQNPLLLCTPPFLQFLSFTLIYFCIIVFIVVCTIVFWLAFKKYLYKRIHTIYQLMILSL